MIFKNRARVLYRDLKHKAITECVRPDKARTANFLKYIFVCLHIYGCVYLTLY